MVQRFIKESLLKMGFDVKRYSIAQNQMARLTKIIQDLDINLVFDVGANEGQFGSELRKIGYLGKIISFEPLKNSYEILIKNTLNDQNWDLAPRTALGEIIGEIEINVAGNTASSSILEMLDSHIQAAPLTQNTGIEIVPIKTLDSLSEQYLKKDTNLFIKIDTQGYEYQVLSGGADTIKNAKLIQLELSLIELYKGQKLFVEMIEFLEGKGFCIYGIEPAFVDPNTGRMLQVDVLFRRN